MSLWQHHLFCLVCPAHGFVFLVMSQFRSLLVLMHNVVVTWVNLCLLMFYAMACAMYIICNVLYFWHVDPDFEFDGDNMSAINVVGKILSLPVVDRLWPNCLNRPIRNASPMDVEDFIKKMYKAVGKSIVYAPATTPHPTASRTRSKQTCGEAYSVYSEYLIGFPRYSCASHDSSGWFGSTIC